MPDAQPRDRERLAPVERAEPAERAGAQRAVVGDDRRWPRRASPSRVIAVHHTLIILVREARAEVRSAHVDRRERRAALHALAAQRVGRVGRDDRAQRRRVAEFGDLQRPEHRRIPHERCHRERVAPRAVVGRAKHQVPREVEVFERRGDAAGNATIPTYCAAQRRRERRQRRLAVVEIQRAQPTPRRPGEHGDGRDARRPERVLREIQHLESVVVVVVV
mmetsp:Transcript_3686/g.14415  ORF Transcript_3686/g.14415 Transcript_3686/m.14415 type:complete len:220 (-) Transcript_3686:1158-1817(-)